MSLRHLNERLAILKGLHQEQSRHPGTLEQPFQLSPALGQR
jgi:hypothetical protein